MNYLYLLFAFIVILYILNQINKKSNVLPGKIFTNKKYREKTKNNISNVRSVNNITNNNTSEL